MASEAPKLEFEWEVGLFRAFRALWRGLSRAGARPPEDTSHVVALGDVSGRLSVVAQLVAGEPVRVREAAGAGGVRGRDLLLPSSLAVAPDVEGNQALYLARAVVAAAVRRLGLDRPVPDDPLAARVAALTRVVRAVDWLRSDLPGFGVAWRAACALTLRARPPLEGLSPQARVLEEARQRVLRDEPVDEAATLAALRRASARGVDAPACPLWGELVRVDTLDETTGANEGDPGGPPDGTEVAAPPVDEVKRVLLDEKEQAEAVLMHTFEKTETLDNYQGLARDACGDDELDEHLEALEELDLREILRGGETPSSIYKAELQLDADVPDVGTIAPDEKGIPYDEWDFKRRAYRKGWCVVYPADIRGGDPRWAAEALVRQRREVTRLHKRLEAHRMGLMNLDRQRDGDDVDMTALVDELAARRAGRGGDQRLYVRQVHRRRDFATTVLLDVSLSSDGWVDDRRVLDVAREAVLVLGEVADRLGDRLEILAFASHTRNKCRVWKVRAFEESWALGKARLGLLEPQGYTRIGPAIRHAAAGLAATPADRRLLLLISDGKPNDFDQYEGRYGIADIRQALREAAGKGVHTHALAVDAVARDYLPTMLGPGAWHILPRPEALTDALATVYGRLTAR